MSTPSLSWLSSSPLKGLYRNISKTSRPHLQQSQTDQFVCYRDRALRNSVYSSLNNMISGPKRIRDLHSQHMFLVDFYKVPLKCHLGDSLEKVQDKQNIFFGFCNKQWNYLIFKKKFDSDIFFNIEENCSWATIIFGEKLGSPFFLPCIRYGKAIFCCWKKAIWPKWKK